jgi:EpsI family protein
MRPGATLEQVVPRRFADWTSQDTTDLVAPKDEDSLASRLYGQTVGRIYTQGAASPDIMMLLAHGDTQSDDLQLHRPESCYPAFGFSISRNNRSNLIITNDVSLPSRSLVAAAPDRDETIIYWSRLGEFLPVDRRAQQIDRMRTALKGEIADGLLARFSIVGPDVERSLATLRIFIPKLVLAVAPDRRGVLIGSERAARLAAAGI